MNTMNRTSILLSYGHGGVMRGRATRWVHEISPKHYRFTDRQATDEWLAHSDQFRDVGGHPLVYEGILNRQIAARLVPRLLDLGCLVFDVVGGRWWASAPPAWRALEQINASLDERIQRANRIATSSKSCLYLSLHHNLVFEGAEPAGPSLSARGACWFTSPSASPASMRLAESMAEAYCQSPLPSRIPVRQPRLRTANFDEITRTNCPAVLGEIGFYSSWEDLETLTDPQGQEFVADAYAKGMERYLASCGAGRSVA